MPKYEIHVSQSALRVWSFTEIFEAETEEEAIEKAEKKMGSLEGKELQDCWNCDNDFNVQVEDCKQVPEPEAPTQ